MKEIEKIGVFCSSSDNLPPAYYKEAERLGEWIGKTKKTLVYGGANCGLMESVAKGVKNAGSINIIGIVPKILIDKKMVSDLIGIRIPTENLSDRKAWMNKISDIMIAMPGSVGTLDEAFTVMAEDSIGIGSKKVIFWNIEGFWNGLFSMLDNMQTTGVQNKSISEYALRANTFEDVTTIIENLKIE